ncbi:hypothetical protein [Pseudomonas sp. NPDC089569]|uniref:hypothetical protein n=1 Tax=Pseudomonas sp. NPDC089569 TaxID=3390722 RepID=UPI003D05EF0C
MERKQKSEASQIARSHAPTRAIVAVTLLVAILIFSVRAVERVIDYQAFSQHAFDVMDQFIAAKQSDQPLGQFKEEFAQLAASDRDLGRLMAIAYVERMGTLSERDRGIIAAANELSGKDLYRLLKATSPMFDSNARERYLKGEIVGPVVTGIDMTFNTFTEMQQAALRACLVSLEGTYESESLSGRIKVATKLYAGASWETCQIPETPIYRDPHHILQDTI